MYSRTTYWSLMSWGGKTQTGPLPQIDWEGRSVFTLKTLLMDMTPQVLTCMLLYFLSSKYFEISFMESYLIHELKCWVLFIYLFSFWVHIVFPFPHFTCFIKSVSKLYVCFGFCWDFISSLICGQVFKCLRRVLTVFVFSLCLYHSILYMYYQSSF